MNIWYFLVFSLNRSKTLRKYLGWFIEILIWFQSLLVWAGKKEYKTFADCMFHFRKESAHPWIPERAVEYSWVYKNISFLKGGRVLDVGAKEGLLVTDILLQNGNSVYTIDLNASRTAGRGQLIIMRGDVCATGFEDNFFDAIVMVSTLEHIGIPGRYGIEKEAPAGDFKAMDEIHRILKPGGKVLVTVPYGTGKSLPLNRLYDQGRIRGLFEKFDLTLAQYFVFHPDYELWLDVGEDEASRNNWDVMPWYALACFCALKPAA